MKVSQLIELLNQVDPNLDVRFSCSVECGRGLRGVLEGDEEIEVEEDQIFENDEGEQFHLKKCLNIHISGEEVWSQ